LLQYIINYYIVMKKMNKNSVILCIGKKTEVIVNIVD
jgi:hypothetical protein